MSPTDSFTLLYYNTLSAIKTFFQEKYGNKNASNLDQKPEIILLGQGWFAKGFLEHIHIDKFQVSNITTHSFVNTPMLLSTVQQSPPSTSSSSTTSGGSDGMLNSLIPRQHAYFRHIEHFREKINVKEIIQKVVNIDLENEEISLENNTKLSFQNKYLICGLGSHVDNGIHWQHKIEEIQALPHPKEVIRGLNRLQHVWNGLKVHDAHKQSQVEKKEFQNKICIIGAGLTGTELAFYLSDMAYEVTLLDGLSYKELYTYLSPAGKDFITKRLSEKNIHLFPSQMYNAVKDGPNFDLVIFATGARANPLTASWLLAKQFHVWNRYNVYAGGDGVNHIVASEEELPKHQQLVTKNGPVPPPYPRNAQVAYAQGKYIAEQLNRKHAQLTSKVITNGEKAEEPVSVYTPYKHNVDFHFQSQGISVYCGDQQYYTEMNLGTSSQYLLKKVDVHSNAVPNVMLYENVESSIKKDQAAENVPKPWEDYYMQVVSIVPAAVMDLYYNIFK